MNKGEFLSSLRTRLSGMPKREVEDRINFYSEMIDDRVEEGLSEEDAIGAIGSVDKISEQIVSDIPLARIARERLKPQRQIKALEIVLLVLGAPIWLSLIVAAFSVIVSLYAVLWSLVISIWAVFASLAVSAPAGILIAIIYALGGNGILSLALGGTSLFAGGLAILAFYGSIWATKGILLLSKSIVIGIKRMFIRKDTV